MTYKYLKTAAEREKGVDYVKLVTRDLYLPEEMYLDLSSKITDAIIDRDEDLECSYLDAVPFDAEGRPTGEVEEWVLNVGTLVILDGLEEDEAMYIYYFFL